MRLRRVALHAALRDEDAPGPAAHPMNRTGRLQRIQRRAQRRAAHAQPDGQLALGSQPLARQRPAGGDLGQQAVAERAAAGPSAAMPAGSATMSL